MLEYSIHVFHQEMIFDVIAHLLSVTDVIPHQMGGPWRQWCLSGGLWRQWRSRSGSWRQQPFPSDSNNFSDAPEVDHDVSDVPKVVHDVCNHFLVIQVILATSQRCVLCNRSNCRGQPWSSNYTGPLLDYQDSRWRNFAKSLMKINPPYQKISPWNWQTVFK